MHKPLKGSVIEVGIRGIWPACDAHGERAVSVAWIWLGAFDSEG